MHFDKKRRPPCFWSNQYALKMVIHQGEIQHVVDIITRLTTSQYEHVLKHVVSYNTLYIIHAAQSSAVAKNALNKYKLTKKIKVPPKETAEDHL